jgi:beta-glucanase (GH16 family)
VPEPTCKSGDFKLDSLDDVQDISLYLGDNSKVNWVASGKPVVYNDNSILLTMAPDTVGTLMSSTNYVWYGQVSATLTTSVGAGVVTAFILMSDSKDEIDFEFVGVDLQHAQSNYYAQGITNCWSHHASDIMIM